MAKKKRRGGVFDPDEIYINFTREQLVELFKNPFRKSKTKSKGKQ